MLMIEKVHTDSQLLIYLRLSGKNGFSDNFINPYFPYVFALIFSILRDKKINHEFQITLLFPNVLSGGATKYCLLSVFLC